MAESGAVSWMFEHLGVVNLHQQVDEDRLFEELIEFDIRDIKRVEGITSIICDAKALDSVKIMLKNLKYDIDNSDLEWVAKNSVELTEAHANQVVELLSELQDHDDVQNVYTSMA